MDMDWDESMELEEQPPMEVVLSEIKQMLLADIDGRRSHCLKQKMLSSESDGSQLVYFLLTPEMRYDFPESEHDEKKENNLVHKKTQQILKRLAGRNNLSTKENASYQNSALSNQQSVSSASSTQEGDKNNLEPAVTNWLNTRLPKMLEEIVSQEIHKALSQK